MHTRYAFIALSVILVTACVIAMPNCSSRSTTSPDDGLKAQMQQEIVQALEEIVNLREQVLTLKRARAETGAVEPLEVAEAQAKLSGARLRLAVANRQPDVAMEEFRNITRIWEEQLQVLEARVEQLEASSAEVAEAKLAFLEERIRLAAAIRDMQ